MTKNEAKKLIEAADEEAGPYAYRTYKNRIATGLTILAKYDPDIDEHIGFEHDQIFASDFETTENITPEDVHELGLHGWFISSEADCWSHF